MSINPSSRGNSSNFNGWVYHWKWQMGIQVLMHLTLQENMYCLIVREYIFLMAPLRVLIITFTFTLPPFHLFSFHSSWIFLFLFTFLVFYWNRRFKVIFNLLVAWGFSIFFIHVSLPFFISISLTLSLISTIIEKSVGTI